MKFQKFVLIALFTIVFPVVSYAACVNPPAEMGVLIMNTDHKVMQYCNGDDWIGLWGSGGGGSLPAGAVMAFDLTECPNGWSPMVSAQGRFLVGTGGGYNLGNMGGANTVALSVAQLPSHSHTGTTDSAGNHSHIGSTNSAGAHTHSGSTDSAGAHAHSTSHSVLHAQGGSGYGYRVDGSGQNAGSWRLTAAPTNSTGAHTHSLSINSAGAHTHTVTTNSTGEHTHSVTINNTGSGQAHENRPPYLAVLYCRKD